LKAERRAHRRSGLALGAEIGARQRPAMISVEERLGIEGIDVRRTTVHEQMDNAPRFPWKMGWTWCQRVHWGGRRGRRQHASGIEHAGQSEHAEAHATPLQKLASREK